MSIKIYNPLPKGLSHALFDADQTLYPRSSGFIDEHVMAQIYDLTWHVLKERVDPKTSREDARAKSDEYFHMYHSSIRGLVEDFGLDEKDLLNIAYHHEKLDYSILEACGDTRQHLEQMRYYHKIRLAVLSNGTDIHVHRVIAALDLDGLFGLIHGYNHHDYRPKPDAKTFQDTLWEMNITADKVIFFEDSLINLKAARDLGFAYNVYIGENEETPPLNQDKAFDLWAKTLPEALAYINKMLTNQTLGVA